MAETITGNSYTSENIKNIQAQIDRANETLKTYNTTAATEDELRKRAESEYKPTYNAQVGEQEAAKQSAQTALNNQLAALDRQYQRDAETLGQSYDQQRVTANNTMLARGMNNSSLALAMLNRVESQRNKALENLAAERSANETSAQSAYNDAIKAADAAIGRLGVDLQTNIDARYQALKDAENERVMQATQAQNQLTQYQNDLAFQLEQLRQQGYAQYLQEQQMAAEQAERERAYQQQLAEFEMQKQQYQDKLAQQKWENEFNEKQAALSQENWQKEFDFQQQQYADSKKKSSGSSSSGNNGGTQQPQNTPPSSLEDKYNNSGSDNKSGGKIASAVSGAISSASNALSGVISGLSNAISVAKSKEYNKLYEDGSMRPVGWDS